jgi:hypothetical protein
MKPFDFNKYIKNNPLLKESVNESPVGSNKIDKSEIDRIIQAEYGKKYPNMRKVTDTIDDVWTDADGTELLGHYILNDLEGADEEGAIDFDSTDHEDFNDIVAVRVLKEPTGQVYFWELDKFGVPVGSQNAPNGEIVNGKLDREF